MRATSFDRVADGPTARSVLDLLRRSERYLARHGVEAPEATAEALLLHVVGGDRVELYSGRLPLPAEPRRRFARALARRVHGTPLEHITGQRWFFDLHLAIQPDVFIPRPETEVLVEIALESIEGIRHPVVVDVGTGTGAIALAVKRFLPDAAVYATDVSPAAVGLASRNARRLGLDVDVGLGDLLEPLSSRLRGRLDVVVSNPPYVAPADYEALPVEVRAEPFHALVGGTNVHRRLVDLAARWLRPGGSLVCEIGAEQGVEVSAIFHSALEQVRVLRDLACRNRIVIGRRSPSRRHTLA